MAITTYSELKTWAECPWKHKLSYIERVKKFIGNEFTAFGRALHAVCENVVLTEEGVSGKTAPFEIRNLRPITTEFWSKHYAISESVDKSNTQTFGIPQRIIRSPKNDKFGLSPIPNG